MSATSLSPPSGRPLSAHTVPARAAHLVTCGGFADPTSLNIYVYGSMWQIALTTSGATDILTLEWPQGQLCCWADLGLADSDPDPLSAESGLSLYSLWWACAHVFCMLPFLVCTEFTVSWCTGEVGECFIVRAGRGECAPGAQRSTWGRMVAGASCPVPGLTAAFII